MTAALTVSADQALAYRVAAHGLAERLPAGRLRDVVRGGMRDRPPDGAGPALHARIAGLTPHDYAAARSDGRLTTLYAMRGAAYVVAENDVSVFTAGSLPADEASLREAILAWGPYLDEVGIGVQDALGIVTESIAAVLAEVGGPATKGAISTGLHDLLPTALEPMCPGRCNACHAPEPLFRLGLIAAGSRLVADAPGGSTFVAAEPPPTDKPARQRASLELARRFVHQYAPTIADHLAAWAGIGLSDARARFESLGAELAAIDFGGRHSWALASDLDTLREPPAAAGIRLLPRDDPFVAQRDRTTLAPTKQLQRKLWTPLGTTAALLVDGRLAGLWRAKKQGSRVVVTMQPFAPLSRSARDAIEVEAAGYAAARGVPEAVVDFSTH